MNICSYVVVQAAREIGPNLLQTGCTATLSGFSAPGVRRVLVIALVLNAAMFVFEMAAGLSADSVALQADALDFLGDALTYGISLAVLGMSLAHRATAALVKGIAMALFGTWVLGSAAHAAWTQPLPVPEVMGATGILALVVNLGVAALLYRYRGGDSNMRSVWLCSRNDAIGNLAVVVAALGVLGTGTVWPDLAVAAIMAGLALFASAQVVRHALAERRTSLVAAE